VVRWATKMGVTETSMQTEVFVAQNENYRKFALFCHAKGLTPIFEWCSRQNRVVVDHPTDELVLTAIRKTVSGKYYSLKRLQALVYFFNIPMVKVKFLPTYATTDELQNYIRSLEDTEGIIIRFNDGHMVKVKTDWYVRIHRAKEFITNDRLKIEAILSEKIDDVLPLLPQEDKDAIAEFQKELFRNIDQFVLTASTFIQHNINVQMSRKDFALSNHFLKSKLVSGVVFKCWNDIDKVRPYVIELVLRSTSSNTALEKTAEIWRT
jgi:T4 RnlA family RNA ligase